MLKFKKLIGIMIVIIVLPILAFSIGPRDHDSNFKDRREKMKKYRTWKMTEYLDLTSEQSQKFFPEYNEFENKMMEKGKEFKDYIIYIDSLVQKEAYKPTEKDYHKFLQRIDEFEQHKIRMKKDFLEDIDSILTTKQKIKLLIFDDKFKHEMFMKLRKKHFHDK